MAPWEVWFAIVPGLILFLYGIENFSREIQRAVGDRFRSALGRVAAIPLGGFLLGAAVTGIVQSSTATSVIAVGLVNAGTLSFAQSLGIMFGANVGSTITAQLVAFKLTGFGPAFIVSGFLLSIAGGRYRFIGKSMFYFGLVFFSLALMSEAVTPLKDDPEIISLFSHSSNALVGIAVGMVLTLILQSSAVTTGIVVLLSGGGLLALGQAIPIVLGANIGTTATSLAAASRMGLFARRAAMAHLLFNAGGVLLFLPLLFQFESLVEGLGGAPAQQVANAHLIFNLAVGAAFLVFLGPFKRMVEKLVPGDEEETLFQTRFLTNGIPEDSELAFQLIEKEINHAFETTIKLFDRCAAYLKSGNPASLQAVSRLEALNGYLDGKIERALLELSRRKLDRSAAERVVLLVRLSNMIEQVGDRAHKLAFTSAGMSESGLVLSSKSIAELRKMYGAFRKNLQAASGRLPQIRPENREAMRRNDAVFRSLVDSSYRSHLKRLYTQKAYSGSAFLEAVSIMDDANMHLREVRKISEIYERMLQAGSPDSLAGPPGCVEKSVQ